MEVPSGTKRIVSSKRPRETFGNKHKVYRHRALDRYNKTTHDHQTCQKE